MARAPLPSGADLRDQAVSAETGHPLHIVRSRGVAWCRRNPVVPRADFDIDQRLPQEIEERAFVDRDTSAEFVGTALDESGRPAWPSAPRAPRAPRSSVAVRRIPAEGGVRLSGRIDGEPEIESRTMSDEEAEAREPAFRAALHVYAEEILRGAARPDAANDRAAPPARRRG